jgi:hypothetical protein
MRQTIIYVCLCIAAAYFAVSCDEKENPGTAPGKVGNISHQADFGSIVFTWTQPDKDENYYYTDIRYEMDGVEYSKKATKYKDSTSVEGLTSDKPVDFRFYSVSKTGVYSEPVIYPASSYAPPFSLVAQSVDIVLDSADLKGVFVRWKNETGKKVNVEVSYIGRDGALAVNTFSAAESGEALISNISTAPAKQFSVVVKDSRQNVSGKREFTLDVVTTSYLDQSTWSVPGYDGNSKEGTVGYSSQALNEATAASPKNGSVLAIFDGDINSFWHASWSSPSTVYPHWFIVDLGKEYAITHVEMTRRQSNSGGQKGFALFTCTADGAADASNPETWNWQSQGEFIFDQTVLTPQNYKLNANPQTRYIKVYMDTQHKGSSNYAMVAEFGAYAVQ